LVDRYQRGDQLAEHPPAGQAVARGWRDYLPRIGSWRELTDWLASVAPAVAAFFREFAATLHGYLRPLTR
jgi:hypothetical protein